MTKVAFLLQVSQNWLGGVNYMKNLFYAINSVENDIEIIIFIPKKNNEIYDEFKRYGKVIEVSFLNKFSLTWLIWKISKKITKSDFIIELYLIKYKIQFFSHSGLVGLIKSKTINWIPDFQHIHLPNLFSKKEIIKRNSEYKKLIAKSDVIILSSNNARIDCLQNFDIQNKKIKVLHFVSQLYNFDFDSKYIYNKYSLDKNFFYMPNQFWKHKNHLVVYKALKILQEKSINIQLVCSGKKYEFENDKYFSDLSYYQNNFNIKTLGIVEYKDVIALYKESIAVINPSLFEGWSSSVEECKSLGKYIILSDLLVHKEQNPKKAIFFNRYDEVTCAKAIEDVYKNKEQYCKIDSKDDILNRLKNNTINFANNYYKIINELCS